MQLIDAHQHYWSLSTPGHVWPTSAEAAIHRDRGPADLAAEVKGRLSLTGTILVQSQPTDADTDWMLALADREASVLGVVGWVDLAHAQAPARIAKLAGHPKLRGLRPMLQSIADTQWLLDDALSPAIEAMIAHGLRFDALIQPRHLPMLYRFARRWPDLPIVIDHAAKPLIAAHGLDPWRADIARLADAGLMVQIFGSAHRTGRWRVICRSGPLCHASAGLFCRSPDVGQRLARRASGWRRLCRLASHSRCIGGGGWPSARSAFRRSGAGILRRRAITSWGNHPFLTAGKNFRAQ